MNLSIISEHNRESICVDQLTILIFQVKAQSNTSHASEAPSTVAIARQIALEEGELNNVAKRKPYIHYFQSMFTVIMLVRIYTKEIYL